MRLVFLCFILLIMCSFAYGCAHVEPVVLASHSSALTRGEPFNPEQGEVTVERLEAGIAWTHGPFETTVTHGRKWIDSYDEQSTTLETRWYPRRKVRSYER